MEINFEVNSDNNLVVYINGHFDLFRINNLKYVIESKIREYQFNNLILNFKGMLSIDPMGISKLITIKMLMLKEKKKLQIFHIPDGIKKILFYTKMDIFLLEDNETSSENYIN